MTDGTDRDLARRIGALCYGAAPVVEPGGRYSPYVFRLRLPGGAKFLKLAPGADPAPIRKEMFLIDRVGKAGVPVPAIEHADPDGASVGRAFVVMASAGDQALVEAEGDDARRLYADMARVLAAIHGIAFPAPGTIQHDGVVAHDWNEERMRFSVIAQWLVGQGVLEARDVEPLATLPMPRMSGLSLCHGDFHAVQCVVRDGRISAVLDWDGAWAGNPDVDVAIAHAYTELYAPPEIVELFLSAYTAVRPLAPDYARASVPVRMAQAIAVAWVMHARKQPAHLARAVEQYRTLARGV